MDIDIRKAVINNLHGGDYNDIHSTITDAIKLHEEKTLPGLGVLFELLWQNSTPEDQSDIIKQIAKGLQ